MEDIKKRKSDEPTDPGVSTKKTKVNILFNSGLIHQREIAQSSMMHNLFLLPLRISIAHCNVETMANAQKETFLST